MSIENIETMPGSDQGELAASQTEALERVSMLIQRLKPLDRQIIVSYLEGMDASSIGEITGLSPATVNAGVASSVGRAEAAVPVGRAR